jgi:hypothetical protein
MPKTPPFAEMIAAATTSAVHLETRDAYDPETPPVQGVPRGRTAPGACEPGMV